MSFSQNVKEAVLVACGRHCSLCHKFCGLKIELHHIKPKAEGGPDTFDNCIPLCFECHADMRSYDFKHPKGTKYTEAELKEQRNNWYSKITNSSLLVSSSEYLELDRQVFKRFMEILSWDKTIMFIRNHTFANPFRMDFLDELDVFWRECDNPAFEFIDADLEGVRANLLNSIILFLDHVAHKTFPMERNNLHGIDKSLSWRDPQLYIETVKLLDKESSTIADHYDTLVKLGRRKLGI